ncbi:GNAT family N-acetyltransferase [Bacillus lacus]|uniref:GNAT family N-acetyltransferase n=1 Tax=Metabacillus lacus TaxID=1983721 RepID=A0A7X2IXN4_9BACI|nr:GNAT family N-acetyltransferase [Metabacillus lacus]MRX71718.1 GNAT family N-acetyltransferase [Metabacillus lacus]
MLHIEQTEDLYFQLFCEKKNYPGYCSYSDKQLKDMFSHQFLRVCSYPDKDHLYTLLQEAPCILGTEFTHVKLPSTMWLGPRVTDTLSQKGYLLDLDLVYAIQTSELSLNEVRDETPDDKKKAMKDAWSVMYEYDAFHHGAFFARSKLQRKQPYYLNETILLFACYENGKPVGSTELFWSREHKTAKLEELSVLDDYQGRGFGSSLVKKAIREAGKLGISTVYLVTSQSDGAQYFYEKLGFSKVKESLTIHNF